MNPEKPSRDEIEAKLTALLLGELPEEEARLLRWTISQDPALARLHEQLKLAIGLVREVSVQPDEPTPRKLSDERRKKLFAHFKTPRPAEPFLVKPLKLPSLITVLAVVAITAILAAMLLPALSKAKHRSKQTVMSGKAVEMETRLADSPSASAQFANKYSEVPASAVVAAAPTMAPPPATVPLAQTEIILPKSGESGQATDVYLQNSVGYANTPAGVPEESILATNFAVSDGLPRSDGAIPMVVDQNTGLPAGGVIKKSDSVDRRANRQLNYGQTPGSALQQRVINNNTTAAVVPSDTFALNQNGAVIGMVNADKLRESDSVNGRQGFGGGGGIGGFNGGRSSGNSSEPAMIVPPTLSEGFRYIFPTKDQTANPGQSAVSGTTLPMGGFSGNQSNEMVDNNGKSTMGLVNTFASAGSLHNQGLLAGEMAATDTTSDGRLDSPVPATSSQPENGLLALGDKVDQSTNLKKTDGDFAFDDAKRKLKRVQEIHDQEDLPLRKPAANAPIPQPEVLTTANPFSTFAMNVSDVSFKLAAASLEKGLIPDASAIRSEEFINAFDYRDPEAAAGEPIAFTAECAQDPFAQSRDLLRFSIKTAATGRQPGRPLNLVLLLDNSGSMERADRVAIIRESLRVLATQLEAQDTITVVTFARTARLWLDGVPGNQAGAELSKVSELTPQGGTNLEEALRLAYAAAHRHYLANGMNRVVLLTDGAANLGNVDAARLTQKVEAERQQGVALDCFGIGWEDYNDDLLEQLSSHADGRYAFLNSPADAANDFAAKLAGALQIAAQDVKVQVQFNPDRVTIYRQIGYARHQLTKEQFRDNTVAAGEIAAAEAGNALYTVEIKPDGHGPLATVRLRYRVPGTQDYRERSWNVDYTGNALALDKSSAAMRLAATAAEFSEWLATSPYAQEVTPDRLLNCLSGVPAVYGADARPQKLEWMIRQTKSLAGKIGQY